MFYGKDISPRDVVECMAVVQKEIQDFRVHIGLGIHTAEFIEIGGGMFGPEADVVENLAEDYTEGKEIAVTGALKNLLLPTFADGLFSPKVWPYPTPTHSFNYAGVSGGFSKANNTAYPFPFNQEFFEFLKMYNPKQRHESEHILSKYGSDSIVVLVKVHHTDNPLLLEELAHWVLANSLMKSIVVKDGITVVKSNGNLGIFLAQDAAQAIGFARDVAQTFKGSRFSYNIGIASGEVLVFPLADGDRDIAGEPVNIASKISEDIDEKNALYVHNSVALSPAASTGMDPFKLTISHIQLQGLKMVP